MAESDPDLVTCPVCGCAEALIVAVGTGKDKGKLRVFCPQEQKYRMIDRKVKTSVG